ncbi:MAG: FIST C-terminal domain-containing protein [Pseudomonadota bacterium]
MLLSANSTKDFSDQLAGVERQADQSLLVLIGAEAPVELADLAATLKEQQIPALGGFFTSIVFDGQLHADKALAIPIDLCASPSIRGGTGWVRPLPPVGQLPSDSLSLLLYQPYRVESSTLATEVFDRRAHHSHYLGGGAARHMEDRAHALFCDGQLVEAIVATMPGQWSEAIAHGWHSVSGPLIATQCDGRRIFELNWRPAAEAYLSSLPAPLVEQSNHRFKPELGITYPLALQMRPDGDCLLRPPMEARKDGSLLVAGIVPENAVVHVAEARDEDLLAVSDALIAAAAAAPPIASPLVLACRGRQRALGDERFGAELKRVSEAMPEPLVGMVCLGEIASDGRRYVDVHHRALAMGWPHA